jgi:hypothetical protein
MRLEENSTVIGAVGLTDTDLLWNMLTPFYSRFFAEE